MELEPFGVIIYTGIMFLNCRPLHCRKWVRAKFVPRGRLRFIAFCGILSTSVQAALNPKLHPKP